MIPKIFSAILIFILLFAACKKENGESNLINSNLDKAPEIITQSFNIEITIENNRVVEVLKKTGVTEFSKSTYKYTPDTIFENLYELGKLTFLRKHHLKDNLIMSTVDSSFGRDTVKYFRIITYLYDNGNMSTMQIEHYDILDLITKITTTRYDYLHKDNNLFEISYESQSKFDSTNCSDRFTYSAFETKLDVKNILGISEGNTNKNLKSSSTHFINCNLNGITGSTTYEYWYSINEDKRITQLIYRKTFNGTAQTFKENYKYILR